MTATDRGASRGSIDRRTAAWSRASMRSRSSGVAAIGNRTLTVPEAPLIWVSNPASENTSSIGASAASTSAQKALIPAWYAAAARHSSRRVPTPWPCSASVTANAASASVLPAIRM